MGGNTGFYMCYFYLHVDDNSKASIRKITDYYNDYSYSDKWDLNEITKLFIN